MTRAWLVVAILFGLAGCTPKTPAAPAPAAAVPAPAPTDNTKAAPSSFVIRDVSVWDGTGAPLRTDQFVTVASGRIAATGAMANFAPPTGTTVIDGSGKFVTPGLIDSHVHFFQSGGLYTRPDVADFRSIMSYEQEVARIKADLGSTFRRYLAVGVTAVVDVGGPTWNFEVRSKAEATARAPRVAVAGPLISTVERAKLDIGDAPIQKVDSPAAATAAVVAQLRSKPDLIKIWFIVNKEQPISASRPIVDAAIKAAHRGGVRVAVHATERKAARVAVELGADILVHNVEDKPVDTAFAALLKRNGVILIPTLTVFPGYARVLSGRFKLSRIEARYGDPAAVSTWRELAQLEHPQKKAWAAIPDPLPSSGPTNAKFLSDAGVTLAAGSDAGNIGTLHAVGLHRELAAMVKTGISTEKVLLAATRDAARVFTKNPDFGTIEIGKRADLLLLDANPLTDIGNLQTVALVVARGIAYRPDELMYRNPEGIVDDQIDAYNAGDLDAFLGYYADDIVTWNDGKPGMKGLGSMRVNYGALFKNNPDLKVRIIRRVVSHSHVIDLELLTTSRGSFRATAIYQVENGKIVEVRFVRAH